jgi:hypothetical protein
MCVADTDFFLEKLTLHDETRDDTCATPMIRFLGHGLRFECINELFLLCLKDLSNLVAPFFLKIYLTLVHSIGVQRKCASP